MFPFCALPSRIMARKGWSVEDDYLSKAFWELILIGPRPPSTRWPPAQRAPAPKGRPQQKKERPSPPLVQQPKEGPTTVENLTKASSALDGSSPEAQVLRESLEKARQRPSPEPIRVTSRSSFGSSGEDCEAGDGNYSSGARRFNGEISVGGSFADSEVDTSGERLDSCLQFIERASKMLQLSEVDLAPVLQKKARVEDELAQARQNLEVLRAEASETAAAPLSSSACQRRSGATLCGGCKVDGEGRCKVQFGDDRGREIASRAPRSSEGEILFEALAASHPDGVADHSFVKNGGSYRRCRRVRPIRRCSCW